MKKQTIARLWVFLVTALMSSAAMSQAVIKYDFFAESYNFHLTGKQWGTIHGLNFEVRQSFGSLLGEPVTNNNVRYWFDGQESGISKPTVHLYREVIGTPQTQGIPYPNGDTWAIIDLWGGDDISVSRTAGLLKVKYPFKRFIDQVQVVSAHFVGGYGQINMLGGFNGVFGSPGNWGWNFPGSPSWSRALVSSYNYTDHGSQPINWYSKSEARDLFAMLIKECQPVCQGQARRLQDLNLGMYGVLNDIAAHSEDFRMAYYASDQRATMLRSLMSAAQAESDPLLRKRRQALANRAMEAFGDEQSHTYTQQQAFAVAQSKQSTTKQAMAVTHEALCQMMSEGKVQEDTLARLKRLVQQQGALPRQLQDRAGESLEFLSKTDLGTGDLRVTLTWKDHGERGGPYFGVFLPNNEPISFGSDVTYTSDLARWSMSQAPAGQYNVWVKSSGPWGLAYDYQLRIQGGGKVDVHEGRISAPGGHHGYDFTLDTSRTGGQQRCQNLTEL